jgi:osmotically-inducible protein OsmY
MMRKSDEQILEDVLRELRWDSRVDATEVGVAVGQGVVTLTGTVANYATKVAAKEAAHRVAGVLDVANDIRVEIPGSRERTDTEIAQAVRQALAWNVLVPHERITSTVDDGWVTLEGSVERLRERTDAERAVWHLQGVCGVTNKIVVRPSPVQPARVRAVLEEALERCATREAEREAERLQVQVSDGVVTLTGRVHSYEEKRAVLEAVSHAPGVHTVQDHLRMKPEA